MGIPSRYVTSQLGELSLASLRARGRYIEYQPLHTWLNAGRTFLPSGNLAVNTV